MLPQLQHNIFNQLYRAAKVIRLDRKTAAWLEANDPKAFEQLKDALSLVDFLQPEYQVPPNETYADRAVVADTILQDFCCNYSSTNVGVMEPNKDDPCVYSTLVHMDDVSENEGAIVVARRLYIRFQPNTSLVVKCWLK